MILLTPHLNRKVMELFINKTVEIHQIVPTYEKKTVRAMEEIVESVWQQLASRDKRSVSADSVGYLQVSYFIYTHYTWS